MKHDPLLKVENLTKHYAVGGDWFTKLFDKRVVHAVDNVSFEVEDGKTLGLVGESGSGKTTVGKILANLVSPSDGTAEFNGESIFKRYAPKEYLALRRNIQMIFQDPSTSLNRRKTIGQIVSEPLYIHKYLPKNEYEDRLVEIMEMTGLPKMFMNRYPHELSGGQRQRVGIARALSVDPRFIICDEPVTALDVSIQAQIINLLLELQEKINLSYLFIAHDLNVVKIMSDRIAVMYLGWIMETADSDALFNNPKHPYTQALLEAIPKLTPGKSDRKILRGEVPSPISPPTGCRFYPRCPQKIGKICEIEEPKTVGLKDGSFVKCHKYTM